VPDQLISLTYKIKRPLEWEVAILIGTAMHLTGLHIAQDDAVDAIQLMEKPIRLNITNEIQHKTGLVEVFVETSNINNFQTRNQPMSLKPFVNILSLRKVRQADGSVKVLGALHVDQHHVTFVLIQTQNLIEVC
jgi:hypothetical protein